MNTELMNAKQYLSQYRLIDKKIESKTEQLMRLRARMQSLTANYSETTHGGKRADWTDTSVKCMEIESKINSEIGEQMDIRNGILLAIESIENPAQRLILEMRYLNCWPWKRIICSVPYEEAQVYRIHYDALHNVKIPEHA